MSLSLIIFKKHRIFNGCNGGKQNKRKQKLLFTRQESLPRVIIPLRKIHWEQSKQTTDRDGNMQWIKEQNLQKIFH